METEPNINKVRNQARRAASLNTVIYEFLHKLTDTHASVYGGDEQALFVTNLRTAIDMLRGDLEDFWENFMTKAHLAPSQSPHNPSLTVRAIVVAALEEDLRVLTKDLPHEPDESEPDESVFDKL